MNTAVELDAGDTYDLQFEPQFEPYDRQAQSWFTAPAAGRYRVTANWQGPSRLLGIPLPAGAIGCDVYFGPARQPAFAYRVYVRTAEMVARRARRRRMHTRYPRRWRKP